MYYYSKVYFYTKDIIAQLNIVNYFAMNILYPDLKAKKILITGGLGFLASQFIKALEHNFCKVIILDKKKSNKKNFFYCDITKESDLKSVYRRIKKKI